MQNTTQTTRHTINSNHMTPACICTQMGAHEIALRASMIIINFSKWLFFFLHFRCLSPHQHVVNRFLIKQGRKIAIKRSKNAGTACAGQLSTTALPCLTYNPFTGVRCRFGESEEEDQEEEDTSVWAGNSTPQRCCRRVVVDLFSRRLPTAHAVAP